MYNSAMELNVLINRNFTDISSEYQKLSIEKSQCQKCSIYPYSKQVVQSEGNARNPTFLFCGEAPGKDESEQIRPFIGRAGQRLREELRKHQEFNKNSCIVTNVLACRPPNNQFPSDKNECYKDGFSAAIKGSTYSHIRVKARELVNFCASQWLRKEIALLKPKVIITLGSVALDYVRGDRGITEHRGAWKFLPQYQAWSMATYHPSYVLRCQHDSNKQHIVSEFEQDIKKIASTWQTIVENDERMALSNDDWDARRSVEIGVEKRILPEDAYPSFLD